MIRTKHIIIAAAAAVAASCSRMPSPEVPVGDTATVRLSASLPGTKAAVAGTAEEDALSHVDWFVFDSAGECIGQFRSASGEETVTLSKGDYTFMAVANLPYTAPEAGSDAAAYRDALEVSFADCFGDPWYGFVMQGDPVEVSLTADRDVELEMRRTACKVEVTGGVTFAFPASSSLASMEASVVSMFVTNIPATVKVRTGAQSGTDYVNDASSASFIPGLVSADGVPSAAMNARTRWTGTGAKVFYCHPNAAAEAAEITATDMVTKLVVCARVGSDVWYYPVGLPGLAPNSICRISDIVISGRGSDDPNTYIQDGSAVRFNVVSLEDWTTVEEECILVRE